MTARPRREIRATMERDYGVVFRELPHELPVD